MFYSDSKLGSLFLFTLRNLESIIPYAVLLPDTVEMLLCGLIGLPSAEVLVFDIPLTFFSLDIFLTLTDSAD